MVKKLDIEIPKCDYYCLPFTYLVNGEKAKLAEEDLIYFSVKKTVADDDYVIQKSLEDGISYNEELEKYFIELNYEDTAELDMNSSFLYDLVIYYNGEKPVQKLIGKFSIKPKITLNEVF